MLPYVLSRELRLSLAAEFAEIFIWLIVLDSKKRTIRWEGGSGRKTEMRLRCAVGNRMRVQGFED